MSYFLLALISTVECQRPGYPPTEAPEEEEEEISAFKRFLHKFGVDLDPSDVIVGLLLIAGISCAGLYFYKMKKDDEADPENQKKDDD
jgi:hypothetical protein